MVENDWLWVEQKRLPLQLSLLPLSSWLQGRACRRLVVVSVLSWTPYTSLLLVLQLQKSNLRVVFQVQHKGFEILAVRLQHVQVWLASVVALEEA